jgi:phage terminase small subunit
MAGLTAKQQAFCEHYVANGFNGLQAAVSAGYSESSAKEIASENLTKPNIAAFIFDFMAKASERALVTVEDVVQGLKKEAVSIEEDSSPAARISAWKALSDYTGGFDSNKVHNVNIETTHEEWLDSLK